MITSRKPKGRKQYICCFLWYQIINAQKHINYDVHWYHVKQFILPSGNSYCKFHILFIYYVLYFALLISTLYFPFFPFFFIGRTWKEVVSIQANHPCFIKGRSLVSQMYQLQQLKIKNDTTWVTLDFKILTLFFKVSFEVFKQLFLKSRHNNWKIVVVEFPFGQSSRLRVCNFTKKAPF